MQANDVVSAPEKGCGIRLRQARLAAGLSEEDVASRLKMPVRVVRSLENEDWSRLGAPVFVRGQLRSYSRLLGLSTDSTIESAGVGPVQPPTLVTHNFIPRHKRLLEQFTHRAIYIVMTVSLVVPVWLATSPQRTPSPATVESLDAPTRMEPAFERTNIASRSTRQTERTPLMASIAPLPSRPAAAPALSLRLSGDSWVQVIASDGRILEEGLLPAGETRSYANGAVARIVLGNAAMVEVERSGELVDLAPYLHANVARFTVSSDGSLAPVAD